MHEPQTTSLDRFLDKARRGVFGTAFTINKDLPVLKRMAVLAMIIDFLQMLAFPLNGSSRFPWADEPAVAPFVKFLGIVAGDIVNDAGSPGTFQLALWLTATIWTTIFLAFCVVVAYNFVHDSGQNVLVLRALRSIATLSTTVLFLPFTTVMFRGIACTGSSSEGWMGTDWECTAPARLVLAVFVVILLLGFSGMSLFIASVFVDRSPKSASWTAKVHGRNDVALLLMKLVIGGVYNIGTADVMGSWPVTVLLILCGGAWYYLCFTRMPFIHQGINVLQGGLAAGFTWASVALGAKQLFKETAPDRIYLGIPAFVALGAALVFVRYTIVTARSLEDCSSLHDVDIWCRAKLRKRALLVAQVDFSSSTATLSRGSHQTSADEDDDGETAALLHSEWNQGSRDGQPDDDFGVPGQALKAQEEALLQEAERGYRFAMDRFGHIEMSFQLAAVFFKDYWPFRYNEALALAHAKRLSPAADIRFYIYQRSRQLRETDQSEMSPLDRVVFDQYWKEVAELRIEAARKMTNLWEILADKTPDLAQLRSVGVSLQETIQRMDTLYWRMMRVNGDSTALLRAYASHLIEFSNDSHRSSELLNRADRIEDVHSKTRTNAMRHIIMGAKKRSTVTATDLMQDNNAIITISGDPTNLGEILFVSSSACRTFGYTSSQLIGQNVHVIVPQPIRRAHDMFLSRFHAKRHSDIVGVTRLVFGQRNEGSIFPMWLGVMEAPPDEETFQPRFTAVAQSVIMVMADENHILFATSQRHFRVYGGSSQSMDLLDLSAEDLGDPATDLSKVIPSLAPDFTGSTIQLSRDDVNQLQRSPSFMQRFRATLDGDDADPTLHESGMNRAAVDNSLAALFGDVVSGNGGVTAAQGTRLQQRRGQDTASHSGGDTMDPLTDFLGENGSGRGAVGEERGDDGPSEEHERPADETIRCTSVPVRPLLDLRQPGIIPVHLTGPGGVRRTEKLFGSVQKVEIPGVVPFYLLRWNHVNVNDHMYGDDLRVNERRMNASVGGSNSSCDSDSIGGLDNIRTMEEVEHCEKGAPPVPASARSEGLVARHSAREERSDRGEVRRRGDRPIDVAPHDLTGLGSSDDQESHDGGMSIPGSVNEPTDTALHRRRDSVQSDDPSLLTAAGCGDESNRGMRGVSMTVRGRPKSILRTAESRRHGRPSAGNRRGKPLMGLAGTSSVADTASTTGRALTNDDDAHIASSGALFPEWSSVQVSTPANFHAGISETDSVRSDTALVRNNLTEASLAEMERVPATPTSPDAMQFLDSMLGAEGVAVDPQRNGTETSGPLHGTTEANSREDSRDIGLSSAPQRGPRASRRGDGSVRSGRRRASVKQVDVELSDGGTGALRRLRQSRGPPNGSGRMSRGGGSSGGSALRGNDGSVTSAGSQSTQLTRAITTLIRTKDPESKRIVYVVFFLNFMVLIMAVASTLWIGMANRILSNLSNGIFRSGQRLSYVENAVMQMFRLDGVNGGMRSALSDVELMETFRADVRDARDASDALFDLGSSGGSGGFSFELGHVVVIQEPGEGDNTVAREFNNTVAEAGAFMLSTLLRLTRLAPGEIVNGAHGFEAVELNIGVYHDVLEQAFLYRQFDFVSKFAELELQLILGGGIGFFVTVVVSGALFLSLANSIGVKTRRVLELFLLIPRGVAKSLHGRSNTRLQRVLLTQVESGGEAQHGVEAISGQEVNEAEEERLAVEEEEADMNLQKVLRRHTRAQASSMARQSATRTGHSGVYRVGHDDAEENTGGGPAQQQQHTSAAWMRPFQDKSHEVTRASVKLTLPVVFVLIWLATVIVVEYVQNEQSRNASNRMTATQESRAVSAEIGRSITTVITSHDAFRRGPAIAEIEEDTIQMQNRLNFLRLGGEWELKGFDRTVRLSPLQNDGPQAEAFRLLSVDACFGSPVREACLGVEDGSLGEGIVSASADMLSSARRLVTRVSSNETLMTTNVPLARFPRVSELHFETMQILTPHLDDSLSRLAPAFQDRVLAILSNTANALQIITWVFVAIFVVATLTMYGAVRQSVMKPLKSSRGMLRLLPSEVIDALPELREEMQDVVQNPNKLLSKSNR